MQKFIFVFEEVPSQAHMVARPTEGWITSVEVARNTREVSSHASGAAMPADGRITTILDVARSTEEVPSQAPAVARPTVGRITITDVASSTEEVSSTAPGITRPVEGGITTTDASSEEMSSPGTVVTTIKKKEYGQRISQAEMLRARIAKQRRDQRLDRMSSSRNLANAQSCPEPSPGTSQLVSKLVSRFETVPSPIKMPRSPSASTTLCRISNENPVYRKKFIPSQSCEPKPEASPAQVSGQEMMS